ncbi:transposase [Photobacterium sp. GJ3]|nr:transposase [Photobacterium sp. GJ3]
MKGRKSQRSATTNSYHPSSASYSRSAKEAWVLATNLPASDIKPVQLVKLYRKSMQIEETFRDLKSPLYGLGLRQSRTRCPKRCDIMLLIAQLLQLVLWGWV